MRISANPSKYFNAGDIPQGRGTLYRVDSVTMESIGDDRKVVVWFDGADKGLALNATNQRYLVECWGEETDTWGGKSMRLTRGTTTYKGKRVDTIIVKTAAGEARQSTIPVDEEHVKQHGAASLPPPEEDIPF